MIDTHTAAFDSVAATYDDAFTTTLLGETYRARTRTRLAQFSAGMRVLELGCGTGEDAVWLAQRGVHVIATDVSLAMLEQTRIQARRAGVEHCIETRLLDLNALSFDTEEYFDGAFSNFGALNCVRDLALLARWLAARVMPNGRLVLVVMAPLCPWEIAAHALHGNWQGATRRLQSDGVIAHVGGNEVRVFYPSAAALERIFTSEFHQTHLETVGVLLPPPYLSGFAARHPRLIHMLAQWEERVAAMFPFNALGDHYVLELLRGGCHSERSEESPSHGWRFFVAKIAPQNDRHNLSYSRTFRSLWGRVRWLQFLFFQQHRHNRLVLERIAGKPTLILPQVMNPKLFRTGEFLAEILDEKLIPRGSSVLDMGTGSGICSIVAAQWAARVVAIDINPVAVRCANINALLNQVEERVEVLQGDLFAPVRDARFDVVLFNPPYLRCKPRSELERALWATDVIERFAVDLRHHLTADGYALIVLSSDADTTAILNAFNACGFSIQVGPTRELISETLTIYRLRHAHPLQST